MSHGKIPIAYFLMTGMDGSEKANVIREVRVKVASLTCGALMGELGADLNIDNV